MAADNEYRIVFAEDIYANQATILRSRIIGALSQNDFGSLTIAFSSDGGSTEQALSLYNFIRELRAPVHMHAVGHVGSAALPLFLAGNKRTCAEHSRFFLHEYDWGFNSRQTLHRIQEAVDRLKSDITISKNLCKERAPKIPAEVLDAISGDAPPAIILPAQAKEFGIVGDICQLDTSAKFTTWISGTVL